jgi:hypothetical protein
MKEASTVGVLKKLQALQAARADLELADKRVDDAQSWRKDAIKAVTKADQEYWEALLLEMDPAIVWEVLSTVKAAYPASCDTEAVAGKVGGQGAVIAASSAGIIMPVGASRYVLTERGVAFFAQHTLARGGV